MIKWMVCAQRGAEACGCMRCSGVESTLKLVLLAGKKSLTRSLVPAVVEYAVILEEERSYSGHRFNSAAL